MDYLLQGLWQAFRLLFSGDPETFSAVAATVKVSSYAMAASLLMGIPLGFVLGHLRFPGRRQARLVVDTLLSLPTVFIGLMVYAFVSRQGPLGHMGLLFTLPGIAIGQTILMDNIPFTVIGTVAKKQQDSNYNGQDDKHVFVPSATARNAARGRSRLPGGTRSK